MQLKSKLIEILNYFKLWKQPEIKTQPAVMRKETTMEENMIIPNWDITKIRTAIKNLSEQIHNLKKQIRQPNVKISYAQYCALTSLKHNATVLCVVSAQRRHKVHLQGLTLEQQQTWLNENLLPSTIKSYTKEKVENEAGTERP